jgi:hypothetical protein
MTISWREMAEALAKDDPKFRQMRDHLLTSPAGTAFVKMTEASDLDAQEALFMLSMRTFAHFLPLGAPDNPQGRENQELVVQYAHYVLEWLKGSTLLAFTTRVVESLKSSTTLTDHDKELLNAFVYTTMMDAHRITIDAGQKMRTFKDELYRRVKEAQGAASEKGEKKS